MQSHNNLLFTEFLLSLNTKCCPQLRGWGAFLNGSTLWPPNSPSILSAFLYTDKISS